MRMVKPNSIDGARLSPAAAHRLPTIAGSQSESSFVRPPAAPEDRRGPRAFTLLEVMIAVGIFFICAFAILQLVSGTLRNARALQINEPDPGMLAAWASQATNMTVGDAHGDFGKAYPGYSWLIQTNCLTNGYFKVDCVVTHQVGRQKVDDFLSVRFFRPTSVAQMNDMTGEVE